MGATKSPSLKIRCLSPPTSVFQTKLVWEMSKCPETTCNGAPNCDSTHTYRHHSCTCTWIMQCINAAETLHRYMYHTCSLSSQKQNKNPPRQSNRDHLCSNQIPNNTFITYMYTCPENTSLSLEDKTLEVGWGGRTYYRYVPIIRHPHSKGIMWHTPLRPPSPHTHKKKIKCNSGN